MSTPSIHSPTPRPSPAARWARETFSRESIFSGLKTLLWLVPLTLLIWIYAERSQLVTSPLPGETIPIEVRSSDPNRFSVKLVMPVDNDRSVIGQLTGPQARIEQVIKNIAPEDNNPSVIITVNATQPGVIDLDTARELSLNHIFTDAAVSVSNCKPATLKVSIDKIVEEDAEVQIRPDQQNQITSRVFTPPKVKIRGPSKDIEDAKSQGPLVVYADFDKSVLQQPGSHQDIPVRIQSDQFKNNTAVTFSSNTVNATIDVRQSEFPGDIKAMPIKLLISPDVDEKYEVHFRGDAKVLPSVPVMGPKDKVDELTNATQLKAYAVVTINPGTGEQSAIPVIHLPDASVSVDKNYTPKEIYYTLKRRDQP